MNKARANKAIRAKRKLDRVAKLSLGVVKLKVFGPEYWVSTEFRLMEAKEKVAAYSVFSDKYFNSTFLETLAAKYSPVTLTWQAVLLPLFPAFS